MGKKDQKWVATDPEVLLTLSADRKTVRLHVPPVMIAGQPEPLRLHADFDAKAIDSLIDHLAYLRARMLPTPRL